MPPRQRLITAEGGLPRFVDLDTPLGAKGVPATVAKVGATNEYKALEVKKGTLVLFHGNLMHKSGPNKSDVNRMAYTFSIINGNLECPDDSYTKPPDGTFEKL